MSKAYRNPLSGWPYTRERRDAHGQPEFMVAFAVMTPLRMKVAHRLGEWAGLVIAIATGAVFAIYPVQGVVEVALAIGMSLAALFITIVLLMLALRRGGEIVMTTGAISVRRWYGWQRFARDLEHSFALAPHDRTAEEQRANDLAIRQAAAQGKVIQPAVYYGQSYHVVLVYGGHRIDLASIYGPNDASAVVARLKYCDRCLNDAVRMSGGISKRPEDDWIETPGGLHDA